MEDLNIDSCSLGRYHARNRIPIRAEGCQEFGRASLNSLALHAEYSI